MKKFLPIFCFLFAATLSAQKWQPSYAKARDSARVQHKSVLLVFAGSDWCGPCKKLERDVWSSEAFRAHADKNFLLYKADFPRKKANRLSETKVAENALLAEKYNPKGHFPLVVLLDAEGSVLGKTGYRKGTPEQYIEHLNSLLK